MKGGRKNLGNKEGNLPKLDLTSIQRESWQWFLKEGILEALQEISPIGDFTGKNWELEFGDVTLGETSITSRQAQEKGLTYSFPLKVVATLTNKQTGRKVKQVVFMGDIPQMTARGTFIINGIERAVVNQLVRSPGVYFAGNLDSSSGRILYQAEIRPMRGSWLEFEVNRNDVIFARIDKRKKVAVTTLLRALGLEGDKQILETFSKIDTDKRHTYIKTTLEKDITTNRQEALIDIYKRIRPGEPATIENAENLLVSLFFDPRRYDLGDVGRFKINKRLGFEPDKDKGTNILTRRDVVSAIKYLIGLQNGEGRVDDIDQLSNRRLRRVGELVAANAFRVGLLRLERSVKEKMSLVSPGDKPQPANLVNARPLIAALNEFFRSNQLSTILDDTNPLSEIDNLLRVSVLGPGGINREHASFSIRDVNSSQYGRIDPIRSPEGQNIGLVTYLALYTRVNEYGFLETPYRKVEKVKAGGKTRMRVKDEVVYLTADDEEEHHITHARVSMDDNGYITAKRVPLRFRGEFTEGPVELVDLVDLTPRQVIGASASLIPFLAHDEGNRALMGSNMQTQAVPLVAPKSPVVGTGMESTIATSMARTIVSSHQGTVTHVDADSIEIRLDKPEAIDKKSYVVSDDLEITNGGKSVVYHLTKFKRSAQSTCYNQRARVVVGNKIKVGDLLADGPSTEDGELALGQNLVIAYCSFEGYGFEDSIVISDRLVKEDLLTSIHIEEYEADVVETKLGPEELTRDIPNVSESELANLAEDGIVVLGAEVGPNDILVGKIAPKGETELTAEERLLRAIFGEKAREVRDTSLRVPHGERGIVLNVQILDKDEGDELPPGVMRRVIVKVAQIRKVTVGDKLAGRHGNKGVISKVLPRADMPYLEDGTPVDIILSPLSVLNRMNLGQLLEAHLGMALQKRGEKAALPVFDEVGEEFLMHELAKSNLPVNGKMKLINGQTGEPFEQETVVGIGYILKLKHMVEDKTHARSTGPYSLVTQQPLGGKAQMGGQRLGEMEVWALEAHRAAHNLQEMLTIKSDDVVGRARAFEAIVKGTDIPQSTVPESFKVLVRELNSLGLSIIPKGLIVSKTEVDEEVGQGEELAAAAGATITATDELVDSQGPMEIEQEAVPTKEDNE